MPPASTSARSLALRLVALVLLGACSTTTTTTRTEDVDAYGRGTESISTSTELFASPEHKELERALQLARTGEHREARTILERLAGKPDLDPELHQEVLLRLGELHGEWTNPFRDFEAGLRVLRRLLTEYPDTAHRVRAEELITQYTAALERLQR